MKENLNIEDYVRQARGQLVCSLAGLPRPSQPITLAPGLSVRPFDDTLSVFDLASAGAAGFRSWSVLEPLAPICTSEIESAKDADNVPGYDTLNRAWLATSLLALRGYTRLVRVACSGYSWNHIAGHQKRTSSIFKEQMREEGVEAAVFKSSRDLPKFKGDLLDFHLQILTDESPSNDQIAPEDIDWTQRHVEVFNRLAAESNSFRLALESAIDWRYAKDGRTAVARLWSGIEAVFGISSELVYRISLLSASLLESRGEGRKTRFQSLKKLYGLRSKAGHGDALSQEQIATATCESYHLLRDLLLLTIEKGHVIGNNDFDEVVFY